MSKHRGRARMPQDVRDMLRAESCADKIAYTDRSETQRAQHGMAEKGKSCKVYPCPSCGKYHLASNKSHGRRGRNGH